MKLSSFHNWKLNKIERKYFLDQSREKWRNYTYAWLFDLIANTVVSTWNNQNVVQLTYLKCIPCSVDFLLVNYDDSTFSARNLAAQKIVSDQIFFDVKIIV